ncbi:Hpt domain-containing protein, partial [Deltaproteobacteria bacterium OttesenSCG-928-K17]|nr:Hpt domain-containing protein [Deltaproteobacteria bacterium OttesenSCG-928-K17]
FIYDARDHLGTAGAQLLELEKNADSLAALNALMGTLHTIKGTSGFFDLKNLYNLVNHAESLLQTIRDAGAACRPKQVELLLQVLDTVEAILDRLDNGEDDAVDWLGALVQGLKESEAATESGKGDAPPQINDNSLAAKTPPAAAAPIAAGAEEGRVLVEKELSGRVNVIELHDGQLSAEDERFPAMVEAMFKAGTEGLVVDLRPLTSVTSRELKILMAAGRKKPEKTAFMVDAQVQESLYRIFMLLHLDVYMKFFPNKELALEHIAAA